MNKVDFSNILSTKIEVFNKALQAARDGVAECLQEKTNIELTIKWINEIQEDCSKDLIPDYFINFFSKNLEALNYEVTSTKIKDSKTNLFVDIPKYRLNEIGKVPAFISSYNTIKTLGFVRENTVVVGANGCGKTTLAHNLKQTVTSLTGTVIPAQKLLMVPTFESVPNYTATKKTYDQYQGSILNYKKSFKTNSTTDSDWNTIREFGHEYNQVLGTMLSEWQYKNNEYCRAKRNRTKVDDSKLDCSLEQAFKIWNSLIEHRTIYCDNDNRLMVKGDNCQDYHGYSMSDGERIILYLIGRVLLAPQNGLIIVDEPELYLHKTIVDKLWNKLEDARQDCLFFYLTHDLDFASSRMAVKAWIKEFTYPDKWVLAHFEDNGIPEDLMMRLVGSRKKILFCEGKKGSLDRNIFELLFPEYTVTPVETCKDVINYTRAFNKSKGVNVKAYGIIDRDFREEVQLSKLVSESIYSYSVAEIENLLLDENFIKGYADYKKEQIDIISIKADVISKLQSEVETQCSLYVSGYINSCFTESHVSKGNSMDDVHSNFDKFVKSINGIIDSKYKERKEYLEDICKKQDYALAIRVYNNKGLHTIVEKAFKLVSNSYRQKALDYLRNSEQARQCLVALLPEELKKER